MGTPVSILLPGRTRLIQLNPACCISPLGRTKLMKIMNASAPLELQIVVFLFESGALGFIVWCFGWKFNEIQSAPQDIRVWLMNIYVLAVGVNQLMCYWVLDSDNANNQRESNRKKRLFWMLPWSFCVIVIACVVYFNLQQLKHGSSC